MKSLDLLAAHLFGDFFFQTDEMATQKLTDASVRARHVARYTLCVAVAAGAQRPPLARLVLFLILVFVAHFVTDSRRWLPNEDWPPGTILNDQALHVLQLAILGRML